MNKDLYYKIIQFWTSIQSW